MGDGSEGEKQQQPEEENRTKRKMKTASQLEILEKKYAEEAYPSESLRAELSSKLGLSDRQLQMWFCHRRMKDRKGPPAKLSRKDSHVVAGVTGEIGGDMGDNEAVNEHTSVLGFGPCTFGQALDTRCGVLPPTMGVPRFRGDMSIMSRYSEPQQSTAELRATAFVKMQLGEPLRENGPHLGMEFDPLPPGAFGTPIGAGMVEQRRPSKRLFDTKIYKWPPDAKGANQALHEYQFIPERPTVRTDIYGRLPSSYHHGSPADVPLTGTLSSPTGHSLLQGKHSCLLASLVKHDSVLCKDSSASIDMDSHLPSQHINKHENLYAVSDIRVPHVEDVVQMERKHKSEEARIVRELEAHEKKIRKELEKQDMLRQKREEQIRKEMERYDRERQKQQERIIREKQREEERLLREQRRKQERIHKESIRAERMRQKEKLRREREAARTKAATGRAIARQNAKESIELIEDERLELMELAALSKGFPSILSLDYDTLQNIDLYRDMQPLFPPEMVQLKRPFSIQPWTDSEENVGSLLMAWRFLVTFADVLGLCSFTLDEFVQAFHDYDPRLLSEIHISLLSCIIKDIEEVAKAPSAKLGGHPQIVEGAYVWGFDIRDWKQHLNPLTWPEILRQFALSAGFGPQLKKRNIEPAYMRDEKEGNDGENVISNLRNGAAAENAVAIMQGRGLSNTRRSRHLLTPGTVKYAAFHVLSLEGSKGLTVPEVADRIQKSGLRDLTTSKTPEASISAALSRDSKLFERTAPSTYCVRAPYRKDPADADALLYAASEKIRIFKNGSLDGEGADDVERDEEPESDGAEDPEVDDLGAETKRVPFSQKTDKFKTNDLLDNGNDTIHFMVIPQTDFQNTGVSAVHYEDCDKIKDIGSSFGQSADDAQICKNHSNFSQEDTDIDDNSPGEPWVQGLTESEYSVLAVEERLRALVALIGIAIEGYSIRLVLEERLEAATTLKKQMWAEMQLDKRRMKEDMTKIHCLMGNKLDHNLTKSSTDDMRSPFLSAAEKNSEMAAGIAVHEECRMYPLNETTNIHGFKSEGDMRIQDIFVLENHKFHSFQQPGYAADKSRSGLKSDVGRKVEEMYVYRSLPLGQDRRQNLYWQFVTSASQNDPGCGRIFVELNDGRWRLIDSEEGFDALLTYLDTRGVRESHLHTMLQRIEVSFKKYIRKNMLHVVNTRRQSEWILKTESVQALPHLDCSLGIPSSITICVSDSDISEASTSFVIELGRNETEKLGAIKRYQDLEKWIWKEVFSSSSLAAINYGRKRSNQLLEFCDYCHGSYSSKDNNCPCHGASSNSESSITFAERATQCGEKLKVDLHCTLNGLSSFPTRIRLLKMLLALIEVSIPAEALHYFWMEGCREPWGTKLNSSSSAADLLQVLTLLESAIKRDWLSSTFETTNELMDSSNSTRFVAIGPSDLETVITLPWIPPTTAAVALRLMEFDAAISYRLHQEVESSVKEGSGCPPKLPSGAETLGAPYQAVSGGSRNKSGKRSIVANKGLDQVHRWKRQPQGRGGQGGRLRSIRNRQKLLKHMVKVGKVKNTSEQNICERSLKRNSHKSNGDEAAAWPIQHAESARNSERSYYDDKNDQASGDEYEDVAVADDTIDFYSKSGDLPEGSDNDVDGQESEDELEADFVGEQGEFDVKLYANGDLDERAKRGRGRRSGLET